MSGNLTIGHLRSAIRQTIGKDLEKEGFSIDNKTIWAKKKVEKKNKIAVFFDCYDYKSFKIEFKILFDFKIFELDEETKRFYQFCNEKYTGGSSFMLCEGDFHPKVRHLEPKLRSAATHIITGDEELNEAIEDCRKVLREEIIPILPKFSILQEFQDFVLNNYTEILRLNLIIPSIIAAKLKSKEDLARLVNFLWEELELETKSDLHIMKTLVGNIDRYSMGSNP